jgi:hypothetical protein
MHADSALEFDPPSDPERSQMGPGASKPGDANKSKI